MGSVVVVDVVQHPEEFSRLSREIGELCEAHRVAAEEAAALAAAAEAAPAVETAAAAAVQTPPTSQSPAGARDRKISLTCALPIRVRTLSIDSIAITF